MAMSNGLRSCTSKVINYSASLLSKPASRELHSTGMKMMAGDESFYVSGAKLIGEKKVRIALTKIDGIGRKKAIQVCNGLGISESVKIKDLTKHQIDQIEKVIGEDHVVHWELKRAERADIEKLISIECYRGIRHQDGLPLRGQRTHTNAKTFRRKVKK